MNTGFQKPLFYNDLWTLGFKNRSFYNDLW
jgi:hypothetical protein